MRTVAAYTCGHSRQGCLPGVAPADQLEMITQHLASTLEGHTIHTIFKDDQPQVGPMARLGIREMVDWVEEANDKSKIVIVVADAKWLFGAYEDESGKLAGLLNRVELRFVRQCTLVPASGPDRALKLKRLIKDASITHNTETRMRKHRRKCWRHDTPEAWYGYRSGGEGKDDWLPHEEELRVVHRCFDLYLAGWRALGIAGYLNQHNVRRTDGQAAWTKTQIQKILQRRRPLDFAEQHAYRAPEFIRWASSREDSWEPRV